MTDTNTCPLNLTKAQQKKLDEFLNIKSLKDKIKLIKDSGLDTCLRYVSLSHPDFNKIKSDRNKRLISDSGEEINPVNLQLFELLHIILEGEFIDEYGYKAYENFIYEMNK